MNKQRNLKKIISMLLVLALLISCLPSSMLDVIAGNSDTLWDTTNWTETVENGETVYTATGDSLAMNYLGSMGGMKSVSIDFRYNSYMWVEAASGIIVYAENGAEWYLDYRSDAQALRLRRNGEYITYPTVQMDGSTWYKLELRWDDTNIYGCVNGEVILQADYVAYGDTFGSASTAKLWQWGQQMSVKNMLVSNGEEKLWDTTNWTETKENNEIVYTATGDSLGMDYLGSMEGMNSISIDFRYNSYKWIEAGSGIVVYAENGAEWYLDYRSDAQALRLRRNGEYITYPTLQMDGSTWYKMELRWDDTTIYGCVDGEVILQADYATYGDTFGSTSTAKLWQWGQPMSVKNMLVSYVDDRLWDTTNWTETEENNEIVYTATGDSLAMDYLGSIEGMNSISIDFRYNSYKWIEAGSGIVVYAENGAEWYLDYRSDAQALRLRRNGEYITYPTLQMDGSTWYKMELRWDDTTIYGCVDGEVILQADYATYGDTFGSTSTAKLWQWGQPMSVKNMLVSYVDDRLWDTTNWTETEENNEIVYTATGDSLGMQYLGSMGEMNSISIDFRYNSYKWIEAGSGIVVYAENGAEWYLDYRSDAQALRLRRNGEYITYTGLTMDGNTWYNMELCWDNTTIYGYVDGKIILQADYTTYGDTFGKDSTAKLWQWGQQMSVKNMAVSNREITLPEWNLGAWIETEENSETVYNATTDYDQAQMIYNGELEEVNSIEFDMRYNATRWAEASGGVVIQTQDGTEWYVDYRADANAVRIRRNGVYMTTAALASQPAADEWMHWQVMWSNTTLYLKVDDTIVLEHNFTRLGDEIEEIASCIINEWGQPMSVKNITFSEVGPDAWNHVDMEFVDEQSIVTFNVTGGEERYEDGQMIVDVTEGGMIVESPRIEATAGSQYSMWLPLRNTFCVRLKNDTSASEIKLYFISQAHGQYSEVRSKTFEIEPNSGYQTYFFNISDLVQMGSANEPYKFTSQVTDSEGYLRGFKFVFPDDVDSGSIAIDAITFEREDVIYNYAGEITSCIADGEEEVIVVKGKVDKSYVGKTVTVYESAVNNYNEGMTYPVNSEYDTEIRNITKLGSAKVKNDGTFSVEVPLYNTGVSRLSSLFLAWVDGVKVSGHFAVENYEDFYSVERFELPSLTVSVLDFGAKGDAFTCDDNAINAAIDYVNAQGGGTVVIPGNTASEFGRRYIVTNIRLKSNVELRIEEGAILWQSQRYGDYDYSETNEFLPDGPVYGHDNDREGVVWAHSLYDNLPLLQVNGTKDEAIENVRITGGGTIRMMDVGGEQPDGHNYAWNSNICVGCSNRIHLLPVGVYNAKHFDMTDITIQRSNNYHTLTLYSEDVYYANNVFEEIACINGDAFDTGNCHGYTVHRNFVYTNDDCTTISVTMGDKRTHIWAEDIMDRDNCAKDYNYISNQLWGGLGIAFIPWGTGISDLSKATIKDITIYDNVLGGESCAIGTWPDNPNYGWSSFYNYNLDNGETDDWSPIQDVTIVNNILKKTYNMRVAQVTNLIMENVRYNGVEVSYSRSRAATNFLHGNFDKVIRSTVEENGFKDETNWVVGLANWSQNMGENGNAGTEKVRSDLNYSGYVKGDGELYQGLYLVKGSYKFTANVNAVSGISSLFVADRDGNIIAELPVEKNTDFEEIVFDFVAQKSRLYRLGIKHEGSAEEIVYLDDAVVERIGDVPSDIDPDSIRTATYTFTNASEGKDFKFYSSSEGGFKIQNGQLVPVGEEGEFKAIVQGDNRVYQSVSVDIYPDENGEIMGGIYLNASQAGNAVDRIKALGVLVESNFEGWNDAGNRIDIIIGSFPEWKELTRITSETGNGNNLFINGVKEPLNLKVNIDGDELVITLSLLNDPSKYIVEVYEYTGNIGEYGLGLGKVGVRSMYSSSNFDNLNIEYHEIEAEDSKDDNDYEDATYDFNSVWDAIDFDFYHSSNGGFNIKDGKLITTGEQGEFKAVLKSDERSYKSVSVDIYPDADGTINSGIYLSASNAGHAVDNINALGILVQSDFVDTDGTWIDAENRVDIIVGTFPKWKELSRTICETGEGNALFVNGKKEPLNLRVDIDGNKLTITLSLVSDPDCYVQTVYEYAGDYDLGYGAVGVRSMFDVASFDNFNVEYVGGVANGNGIPVVKPNANGSASGSGSSSSVDTGDNAGSTILMMAAMAVVSFGAILFILGKKRRA